VRKKDVPQDDEGLMEGKFEDLCYAIDENGKYVQAFSTGWGPKNAAMKQAWKEINERVAHAQRQVIEGKLSPIGYFMEKNIMNIPLLAQHVGFSKRKVKKHLKPVQFEKLDPSILGKYAEAFDVSVMELCDTEKMKLEK